MAHKSILQFDFWIGIEKLFQLQISLKANLQNETVGFFWWKGFVFQL